MKNLMIFAASLAMLAPMAAFAQPARVDHDSKVKFGDLNLNRPADAKILLKRIESAATDACVAGVSYNPLDTAIARASDCHREAVKRAVAQVASPMLTAAYGQTTALAAND